jgi:hypothetical protein
VALITPPAGPRAGRRRPGGRFAVRGGAGCQGKVRAGGRSEREKREMLLLTMVATR